MNFSKSEEDLLAKVGRKYKLEPVKLPVEQQAEQGATGTRPKRKTKLPKHLDDYVLDYKPKIEPPRAIVSKLEISVDSTKVPRYRSASVSETKSKTPTEKMAEGNQPINVAVKTTEDVPKFKGNKLPTDDGYFVPGPSIHQWIAALEASMALQKITVVKERIVMMYSHVHQCMGDARICLQKFLAEEYGDCTWDEVKSQLYTAYTPVGQSGFYEAVQQEMKKLSLERTRESASYNAQLIANVADTLATTYLNRPKCALQETATIQGRTLKSILKEAFASTLIATHMSVSLYNRTVMNYPSNKDVRHLLEAYTHEVRTSDKEPYAQTSAQVRMLRSEIGDMEQCEDTGEDSVNAIGKRGALPKHQVANKMYEQRGTSFKRQGGPNNQSKCYTCGKPGHWSRECYFAPGGKFSDNNVQHEGGGTFRGNARGHFGRGNTRSYGHNRENYNVRIFRIDRERNPNKGSIPIRETMDKVRVSITETMTNLNNGLVTIKGGPRGVELPPTTPTAGNTRES
jgi:hypothetical protein